MADNDSVTVRDPLQNATKATSSAAPKRRSSRVAAIFATVFVAVLMALALGLALLALGIVWRAAYAVWF